MIYHTGKLTDDLNAFCVRIAVSDMKGDEYMFCVKSK